MSTYIALLRAVNVGGNTILTMADLAAICTDLGFESVRTVIQSGNVIFKTPLSEKSVRTNLETALTKYMGKKMDVVVRNAAQLRQVLNANPFTDSDPSRVIVHFCSNPIPKNLLLHTMTPGGEQLAEGAREIYIMYPNGIGRSNLKLPKIEGVTTSRNISTVTKLMAFTADPSKISKAPSMPANEETEPQ